VGAVDGSGIKAVAVEEEGALLLLSPLPEGVWV